MNFNKTIEKIYAENKAFDKPSSYEQLLEEYYYKKLSTKDWNELNKQSLKYNSECGKCITIKPAKK